MPSRTHYVAHGTHGGGRAGVAIIRSRSRGHIKARDAALTRKPFSAARALRMSSRGNSYRQFSIDKLFATSVPAYSWCKCNTNIPRMKKKTKPKTYWENLDQEPAGHRQLESSPLQKNVTSNRRTPFDGCLRGHHYGSLVAAPGGAARKSVPPEAPRALEKAPSFTSRVQEQQGPHQERCGSTSVEY